ncbi:MAG: hypothetical protein JNL96_06810 [Planctomycetaceae bacterium]|nr:hypothetical protein [Planctomycetaceae bacterium]
MSHIRGSAIPARWPAPLVTTFGIYAKGVDCLEEQWERTRLFLSDKDNIDAIQEFYFWRRNLLIWACCTIENFVNDEGLSLVGDEFYKNVERLRCHEKIAVLYALKYRKRLLPTHAVLLEIKRWFELRNQHVHPKARFAKKNSGKSGHSADELKALKPTEVRRLIGKVINLFRIEPRKTKKRISGRGRR